MATIMLTGAGSGLNRGAALELATRGHDVIACVEQRLAASVLPQFQVRPKQRLVGQAQGAEEEVAAEQVVDV